MKEEKDIEKIEQNEIKLKEEIMVLESIIKKADTQKELEITTTKKTELKQKLLEYLTKIKQIKKIKILDQKEINKLKNKNEFNDEIIIYLKEDVYNFLRKNNFTQDEVESLLNGHCNVYLHKITKTFDEEKNYFVIEIIFPCTFKFKKLNGQNKTVELPNQTVWISLCRK